MTTPTVVIELTGEQIEKLLPLLRELRKAYNAGKPCAIMGQPTSDGFEVMFGMLTHEQTLAVQAITAPEMVDDWRRRGLPFEAIV